MAAFGKINELKFIAKVERGNKPDGIRGGRVIKLHIREFSSDFANNSVVVFKRKQWLVEIPENRRSLVEVLISYFNAMEIKYNEVLVGLSVK